MAYKRAARFAFVSPPVNYDNIVDGEGCSIGDLLLTREFLLIGKGGSDGLSEWDISFALAGIGCGTGNIYADYDLSAWGTGGGIGEAEYEYLAALAELAAYILNLNTSRTYQFTAYDFRGIGKFNGKLIGLRNNTIYDLESTATMDDAVNIDAYIEIETDFGMPNYKELRAVFFQDDTVSLTVTDTAGNIIAHDISAKAFRSLSKDLIDKSFTIRIANISGSQITLRRFHSKVNVLEQPISQTRGGL
jgi:hypothetical protein